MRFGNNLRRDILNKLPLRLQRVLTVCGQTQTLGDAEDMRINSHRRLVPYNGTNDIRRLASYSRQRLQVFNIIRHRAVIHAYDTLSTRYQMLRLRVRITHRVDIRQHVGWSRLSHIFRSRIGRK